MIMFHQDESFVLADVSAPLGRAGLHGMDSHKLMPPTDPILHPCTPLAKIVGAKNHPLLKKVKH